MKFLPLCLLSLFLASCAGVYRVDIAPGTIKKSTVRVLAAEGAEGDPTCKRGIQEELSKRGFTLVEGAGNNSRTEDLLVRYSDEWKWDMLMYLSAMDIHFTEPKSGVVKGSIHYKNRFWHTFPDPMNIARRSFEALDQHGAFSK